jgi:hypothetical protein
MHLGQRNHTSMWTQARPKLYSQVGPMGREQLHLRARLLLPLRRHQKQAESKKADHPTLEQRLEVPGPARRVPKHHLKFR